MGKKKIFSLIFLHGFSTKDVVKALPDYIKNPRNMKDLAGWTLLGDGNISFIIDIVGLITKI